jgi:hypothetical protein
MSLGSARRSPIEATMSELAHERPIWDGRATSALPLIATKPLRRTK